MKCLCIDCILKNQCLECCKEIVDKMFKPYLKEIDFFKNVDSSKCIYCEEKLLFETGDYIPVRFCKTCGLRIIYFSDIFFLDEKNNNILLSLEFYINKLLVLRNHPKDFMSEGIILRTGKSP